MTTLVILLHGVGGQGAPMLTSVGRHLPGVTLRAPDGPLAFHPGSPQRAWFSIAGITPANRPERVRAARAELDARIDAAVAETGATRLVLFGFSQGAIMALDAIARGKVSEALIFAGRLAFDGPMTPAPGARALLVGGEHDQVIPAAETAAAAEALQAAGVATQFLLEPGAAHEIGPRGMTAARAFLQ